MLCECAFEENLGAWCPPGGISAEGDFLNLGKLSLGVNLGS